MSDNSSKKNRSWLKQIKDRILGSKQQSIPTSTLPKTNLELEVLETRQVPAVLTVNSVADNVTADDGFVTLREAITAANNDGLTDLGEQAAGADTIVFDSNVFNTPQTIQLNSGQLGISSELTISGTGADQLTVDAQGNSRVLQVSGSGDAIISGLTITGGSANSGGGINNSGDLVLEEVIVTGNSASPNSLSTGGGGIHTQNGSLIVRDSIVTGNNFSSFTAITGGGGINVRSGTALIEGSTISNNNVSGNSRYGAGISVLGRWNSHHQWIYYLRQYGWKRCGSFHSGNFDHH